MPGKNTTMPPEQRAKIAAAVRAHYAARTHKTCPRCGEHLPLDAFGQRKGGLPTSYCKPCHTAHTRERSAAYHRAHPERAAQRARKTTLARYGLTPEQYDTLLAEQDGRCAICRTDQPGGKKSNFAIDHDHTTGAVRGLLCSDCNVGLGQLGDNPARLRAAADYLEKRAS